MTAEDEKIAMGAQAAQSSSPDRSLTSDKHSDEKPSRTQPLRRILRRISSIVFWVPPQCRWDPDNPPKFTWQLNVLFAFAGAFTVCNLYYNHPILNILARDFHVSYETASQIPTAMQAGYAAGLLFICPLGDVFRRRHFILGLMFFTASMWIGLCITTSFAVFTAISCIVGITTVTPQLLLPLVGDLAPLHRRASALSIVVSGFMLGILIARVLSGTVTNFVTWRAIYWLSAGLQYTLFLLLWLFMPDYPSTNPDGLNYFRMLFSILQMVFKHAVLVQACIITFFTSATFTSFWTTLTFLLAGPPYNYDPLVIGLFALIGISAMLFQPVFARLITDRIVSLVSVIIGELMVLVGICLGTYLGTFTIAGPVLQAIFQDLGIQSAQVANRSAIYSVEPKGRNRINTAFMVATFCGQLMGTAAGNHIYAEGGWIHSGSASVGFIGAALLACAVRGPRETGWVGWRGGWKFTKDPPHPEDRNPMERRRSEVVENGDVEKGEVLSNRDRALEEMAAEEGENPLRSLHDKGDEKIEDRAVGDAEKASVASRKSVDSVRDKKEDEIQVAATSGR